ncbi:MAG TPA: translation initiation factor IF-1 [Patescibacteria group bacterium]|nr:translation initiation factor IF-1 [Patescibacteria group bacterium]
MQNKGTIEVEGKVTQALPNTMFRVELNDGRLILATLKGKMRRAYVRIFPGDRIKVEMTPYDENKGRIVFKF